MGCFLGCFGPPKKGRRRRARARKSLPSSSNKLLQEHVEPLLPTLVLASLKQEVATEDKVLEKKEPEQFRPVLREEIGHSTCSNCPKKKVTFDLNITTYEAPLYCEDPTLSLDENELNEKANEEPQEDKQKLPPPYIVAYPSNHRYQNCMDIDDDEDIEELDQDDEDDYEEENVDEEEEDRYFDDGKFGMVDLENQDEDSYDSHFSLLLERDCQIYRGLACAGNNFVSSQDRTPSLPSNQGARNRSLSVQSVLNPVENLSQWKEAKAKEIPSKQHLEKENINLVKKSMITCTTESSFSFKKLQFDSSQRTNAESKNQCPFNTGISN